MTEWQPDICVYHGNCDDGFGAAWVVHKRWPDKDIQFVAGSYGGFEWPADLHGKNILFVDFSLKRDQLVELVNGGIVGAIPRSIVLLDHHKTAEAELKDWYCGTVKVGSHDNAETNLACAELETKYPIVAHFDMEHSGAAMAWQYCFPEAPIPRFIELIEDRDLWRFRYGDDTGKFSAALRTHPHEFTTWDFLAQDVDGLIRDGGSILRGHRKNVVAFCQQAYWQHMSAVDTRVDGQPHTALNVPVVNVPYHYASDCANHLLQTYPDAPFAAAWFRRADGKVQWSLRSDNGRVDVSEVAKLHGGGGHRNAAGFEATDE